MLLLLLSTFLIFAPAYASALDKNINETIKFCSSYVECASVALLEERLCLGNTRKRPYWLPSGHDPKECHEKLKNDYKIMESLEADLDHQLIACLTENAQTLDENKKTTCSSKILRSVPRFSFERTITYVPTNCFTGLERRRERECSTVKYCCGAFDKCEHMLTDSAVARELMTLRMNLQQRAKDCEHGAEVKLLSLPSHLAENQDDKPSWAPSGNVNVRFKSADSVGKVQSRQGDVSASGSSEPGFVNVRFHQGDSIQNENSNNDETTDSSETTNGDQIGKAQFRDVNDVVTSDTETEGNSLKNTDSESPKLSFPETKSDENKNNGLPTNLDDHDKKYEEALKNTNEYKEKIRQLAEGTQKSEDPVEIVNTGINSLVNVGSISSKSFREDGIASGKVARVKLSDLDKSDSELTVKESVVTSSPLILIPDKNDTVEIINELKNEGCGARLIIRKTIRYEKILTLLGEEPEGESMNEIRDLINAWQSNFRKKVVTAKDQAKNKEIEKALEDLVSQFDDVNLKLIKDQANATFSDEDYPHDDAEITGNNCDPLPEADLSTDDKPAHKAELRDENGTIVIVDDGIEKIMINGDKPEISKSLDQTADSNDDKEEPIEWHNEEYRKEIEKFRKEHHINFSGNQTTRNDTTCDAYMRCRAQMHVAVDQCAWTFASSKVVTSLAESSESLLFKSEEPCDSSQISLYEELYEMVIKRNGRLRECLDKRNEKNFADSICLPYNKEEQQHYDHALLRILSNKYSKAMNCYQDANKIQEKCSKLRQCCPYFDSCREEMIDVNLEQAIISMTARINDEKQNCIKKKARDSLKKAVKGLLESRDEESVHLQTSKYGLDIRRGAQLLKRMRR